MVNQSKLVGNGNKIMDAFPQYKMFHCMVSQTFIFWGGGILQKLECGLFMTKHIGNYEFHIKFAGFLISCFFKKKIHNKHKN